MEIHQDKMKILVSIFSKNEKILHIKDNLQELNYEVKLLYADSYEYHCTYVMKKIDELGIHNGRNRYYRLFYKNFISTINEFDPNLILFVNIPTEVITIHQFQSLISKQHFTTFEA